MQEFSEYVKFRDLKEGLWLPDEKAVEGLSKIRTPKPKIYKPKIKPLPKSVIRKSLLGLSRQQSQVS